MSWRYQPYVPVARRKTLAIRLADQVAKQQRRLPARVDSRMPNSFWGRAWADHLESFSDYSNRLPRGRTYLRNGSVVDLVIKPQRIEAIVAGSSPYRVAIDIQGLSQAKWNAIRSDCGRGIDSILDLLAGRLSEGVMNRLVDSESGLFPRPGEITMACSCPDWSSCCKHISAVMYGVGTRLDAQPELLFQLRGVDHQELVSGAIASETLDREFGGEGHFAADQLGDIFGIELDQAVQSSSESSPNGVSQPNVPTEAKSKSKRSRTQSKRKVAGQRTKSAAQDRQTQSSDGESLSVTVPQEMVDAFLIESGFADLVAASDGAVATKPKRKVRSPGRSNRQKPR